MKLGIICELIDKVWTERRYFVKKFPADGKCTLSGILFSGNVALMKGRAFL